MAKSNNAQATFLKDYQPPRFWIDRTDLSFELFDDKTIVHASLHMRQNGAHLEPLILHGEQLKLLDIRLDGKILDPEQFLLTEQTLQILAPPQAFVLETKVEIKPHENTALEGLYRSKTMFCTQCEAEGFRKITYYLDRPDVMSKFTTKIIADRAKYPVLLSNGNPIEQGDLEAGRHFVTWHDPFKKPAYLFALVAGDLACVSDSFTTMSKRKVQLKFYVEHQNQDKCNHAIHSLKNAMRWDEETFGREYDLDIYMVVAVSDFNMGAMENKGLNVFNTKYVLAKPDTATDDDFRGIEGVIGHEYFHNWTGNRITCRDWFQLSLKEGLTVFRDQEFSADMGSRAVKRIADVRTLRATQFVEDSGPMAHPVRPDSYIEINNFYTATVYNKGAEVIRMMRTLLGHDGFRRGMDLYFERHDGQAVTCDDFAKAMADANQYDLTQFKRWYAQAGTPALQVRDEYDPHSGQYRLHFTQTCPPTPNQPNKEPFHIPVQMGLLTGFATGQITSTHEQCLSVKDKTCTFTFEGLKEKPVPSLLRGFSAPVKLDYSYTEEQLALLFAHDNDSFNRWEFGQRLSMQRLLRMVAELKAEKTPVVPDSFTDAFRAMLHDNKADHEFKALALTLPSETYIGEQMECVDVENIHRAREILRKTLGKALRQGWIDAYNHCQEHERGLKNPLTEGVGLRALKNLALAYLMTSGDQETITTCFEQSKSHNMTSSIAALANLVDHDCQERSKALDDFYARFKSDELVLDKWFAVQALAKKDIVLQEVKALMNHPDFSIKNPNKVRSLIGTFCSGNVAQFHHRSGEGYRFLSAQVLALNEINPQIAARLLTPLTNFRRYDNARQTMMKEALLQIRNGANLSPNVHEIVSKSLML